LERSVWQQIRSRAGERAPLIGVGLAIESLYLVAVMGPFSLLTSGSRLTDLGRLTDYRPEAAVAVAAGLVGLFLFYAFALVLVRDGDRAIAIAGTACFSLTLMYLYPITATDVYTYAVQGYIAAFHGLNPLVIPPDRVANDPFVHFAGSWRNSASPYGPLWVDFSALALRVSGPNIVRAVVLLKLLNAAAVVGTSGLLIRVVRGRAAYAAAFFGWNPLVQIELVGNGHNDAVMILLLVAALALASRRRHAIGAAFLAGSILTKYLTIGALPFYVIAVLRDQRGVRLLRPGDWLAHLHPRQVARLVPTLLALFITAAALYEPYWVGLATLGRVMGVDRNYLASVPALIILLVPGSQHWLAVLRFAVIGGIYLWLGLRLLRDETSVSRTFFEALFTLIVMAPHFAGWYLAVLLALAPLTVDGWRELRAVVFAFATTLTVPLWAFVWPWMSNTSSLLAFHEIIVPLAIGPPLVVLLFKLWLDRRGVRRRQSDELAESQHSLRESA